jgi:hypothetical protein
VEERARRPPHGNGRPCVMLEFTHPRTGTLTTARQAVRIARDQPSTLTSGQVAEVVCWGSCRADRSGIRCSRGGSAELVAHQL